MVGSPYEWAKYKDQQSNNINLPQSFVDKVKAETETPDFSGLNKQIQLERAKEYLKENDPKDGSEPHIEWCIISDLIRIIEKR